jgi:cyclophilin family peptidyl-prolyl cis-trans isomerase
MAKKKPARKRPEEKIAAERSEKTIRYVAIAAVVVVIGLIVWQYLPKSQPGVSIDGYGAAFDCSVFDSIPGAAQYAETPPMKLDSAKQYFAAFEMEKGGQFVIQLYPDKAPITVNSFVFLSCKNFYDGVTFHRVLDGFMAQGGDPQGTGQGGPGYQFVNEDSDLKFDGDGMVAMANAGRDTNGSQFFITFGPQDFLNGGYTIFGQVVEGMDVVNGLKRRDPDQSPTFAGDAIRTITITEK